MTSEILKSLYIFQTNNRVIVIIINNDSNFLTAQFNSLMRNKQLLVNITKSKL